MAVIVIVQTLAEFLAEAPPPGPLRLSVASNASDQTRLDLQALGAAGLVWLHDHYGPSAPRVVHEQLPAARDLVADWLQKRGYEVRPGRWATPAQIRPERGRFEAFYWAEAPPGWRLTSAE